MIVIKKSSSWPSLMFHLETQAGINGTAVKLSRKGTDDAT
jgi:hypothetical protein